ncbi:MAG: 1-deoxy-D-xylulose-5-phosphate reductoisomerase [Bacteroidales bacterium]|nr:1-deoxy-D-xylulose-5-phosphate reductoisomerase [Bacteroidales bacterium]
MKKSIAILGSTGSIGTQALEVVDQHPDRFEVEVLTAGNNADLLIAQAKKHKPNVVVIGAEDKYDYVNNQLDPLDIKVYTGDDAVSQIVEMASVDIVLIALVGFAGLKPAIKAIEAGKQIALANKECLVVAGEIITSLLKKHPAVIIPVDSEHSAIFQCLTGESPVEVEKIILTASGGPFRNHSHEELQSVGRSEALSHPNWNMGTKITIDSATMMNKGLEVIEAKWLFGLKPEQIEVVLHPQSIIHSIVQFVDGSMKAQLSLPDMRIPIQYAFTFPGRLDSSFPRLNLTEMQTLTFERPDIKKFRNLALAFEALKKGGNAPCVLNAANETVVSAFLDNRIGFLQMPEIIGSCLEKIDFIYKPGLSDLTDTDLETRNYATFLVEQVKTKSGM